ncbi:MAG: alpha/beta hydrolase [Proteiniphilum sp.]|nr:alpha/beta hydrolase [Proteiniphilum sp.]
MSSFRSRLVIGMIKNRHLFSFQLKPEVVDESFSVEKFRESVDKSSIKVKLPKSISTQKISIGEINAEWIIPQHPKKDKILLYIHGGGFISGSTITHRMHVAKFAERCQLKSLVFDYRLAPEHSFPAATEDCVAIYKWLLDQGYKSQNVVVGGESAGATLTLSLLLALKAEHLSLPKAAFSISPVTDLSCSAKSFEYNAKNDVAPMGSWTVWTNLYISGNDTKNPLLSPLFGNYEGIPPLYICAGTHEIHLDDCVNVAGVATAYGVDVTLRKWDNMVHAFPLLTPLFPEAREAFGEICDFIANHTK